MLLLAGVASGAIYVVGDLISVLLYNGSRPYSFRDQWISELTAYGSPVRPLMVTIMTISGLLGFAFAYGILRAAGERRSLRWTGLMLVLAGVVVFPLHPFFPMSSRWMESGGSNDTMHATLTFIWGPIIFLAVALSAAAYRGWFRLFSISALVAMMGFGVASGIAIQGIEQNDTPWAGAFERVNAYVLMAWLVLLALMVIRHELIAGTEEKNLAETPRKELVTV
ncbi:MAG TPA: DUF998 domain-containing protein [Actinomycetota bacterium]